MISHSLMVDRGSAPTRFIILYHVMDSMESESLRFRENTSEAFIT